MRMLNKASALVYKTVHICSDLSSYLAISRKDISVSITAITHWTLLSISII